MEEQEEVEEPHSMKVVDMTTLMELLMNFNEGNKKNNKKN